MNAELSISRLFTHFAAIKGDEPALLAADGSEQVSWIELDRVTNRLARAYCDAGVAKDNVVAIVLPNSVELIVAAVAVWKLGGTVLPLSHKSSPVERDRVLELAEPVLVVGTTAGSESVPTLPPGFTPDPGISDAMLPDVVPTYWKALASGGSTGRPKLFVSHDSPYYDPSNPVVDYMHAGGIHLVCGPLDHNATFVYSLRGLFCGNRLVVMHHFDPEHALDLISRHQVTWLQLVPTQMHRLRRLPAGRLATADVSSVRTLLHVGGPCSPHLKQEYIDWLGPERVVEVYAGVESQGITRITGTEWLEHRGSVGRAIRESRFQVQDEDGREVPPGTVGEIFLMPAGGAGSTYHYIGAEPRSRAGGESLGDLGYSDSAGYLYLVGRLADCIVSGGANIYPAEVEGAVEAHWGVRACAVIGLPDDGLGQRVAAIVELVSPGPGAPSAEELDNFLRPLLSSSKLPREYDFVDGPLRDEAGKVRRSALRQARLPGGPDSGATVMPPRGRWRDLQTGSRAVDELLQVLDLDPTDTHTFEGKSMKQPDYRVFGGQVLGQAVVAAARTLDEPSALHSIHCYFARAGDPTSPITYTVAPLRDGRSFHLRRVDAWQGSRLIATVICSLQKPEPDHIAHQLPDPGSAIPPADTPQRFPFADPGSDSLLPGPVELREGPRPTEADPLAPSEVWLRVPTALPDDPLLHQVLVVYMSDFTILRAAVHGHRLPHGRVMSASLDHSMWLHRHGRANQWMHYVTTSPASGSGRALGTGSLFSEHGELVATIGQEMVIRLRSEAPDPGASTATASPASATGLQQPDSSQPTGKSAHA